MVCLVFVFQIERLEEPADGKAGRHRVTGKMADGKEVTVECNTVSDAIDAGVL